uniref:Uncharacterized protein n=1 Tax=Cacopsylla melanoneura TaxID=428564 RepID=A0A8D8VRQ1_9HEMI
MPPIEMEIEPGSTHDLVIKEHGLDVYKQIWENVELACSLEYAVEKYYQHNYTDSRSIPVDKAQPHNTYPNVQTTINNNTLNDDLTHQSSLKVDAPLPSPRSSPTSRVVSPLHNLTVFHLNIESLKNKIDLLEQFLNQSDPQPSVVGLTEHWLHSGSEQYCNMANYQLEIFRLNKY